MFTLAKEFPPPEYSLEIEDVMIYNMYTAYYRHILVYIQYTASMGGNQLEIISNIILNTTLMILIYFVTIFCVKTSKGPPFLSQG
jgi:hypothetical protein